MFCAQLAFNKYHRLASSSGTIKRSPCSEYVNNVIRKPEYVKDLATERLKYCVYHVIIQFHETAWMGGQLGSPKNKSVKQMKNANNDQTQDTQKCAAFLLLLQQVTTSKGAVRSATHWF